MVLATYWLLVLLFGPSFDTLRQSPRCSCAWCMQLSVSSVVDDMLQICHKCLFCDLQSEPVICDDVLISSFFAFTPIKYKKSLSIWFDADPCNTLFIYQICCMHLKIRRTQLSQLCSLEEKNYFVHIHIITKLFDNNSLKCCHKVRISKQHVHANKVYLGKERLIM